MRERLQAIEGQRVTFRADFSRVGKKTSHFRLNGRVVSKEVKTILLLNVLDSVNRPVCDHIWFTMGKQFEDLKLKEGDRVQFDAESVPYTKGYAGWRDGEDLPDLETDYKLRLPTRVKRLTQEPVAVLPLFQMALL